MSKSQLNLADPSYVQDQYRVSDNLEARIVLHERFSTAMQKWFEWYWEHFDLPVDARILEVGCGTGMLWRDNRARIPVTWRLTLSDFSLGMVESCATHINADFLQSDTQAIPFADATFDAVITNHMLYHVPDLSRALAEFQRVLKYKGKLYAATNGDAHLRELKTWVSCFISAENSPGLDEDVFKSFSLENGAGQLGKFFNRVERFEFQDSLAVTQVEPLVAYVMSGFMGKKLLTAEREDVVRQKIAERIARDGAFRITKSTGLFIASGS